jgi:hypothetical protein
LFFPEGVHVEDSAASGLDVYEESLDSPEGIVDCQVEVQLPGQKKNKKLKTAMVPAKTEI